MSIITCEQNLINNGVNTSDTDGDLIFKCIKFIGNKTDTAITQLGLLPPDVSSYTAAMSALQVDVNKLKSYTVVNVKDYGAIGDDTAIDTVAIQNAINACPVSNAVLYFPTGTYRINGKITFDSKTNFLIKSDSARIRHTTGVDTFFFSNMNNLNFSGSLYIFTQTSNQTCQAVVIDSCQYSKFKDLHIGGDFLHGIHVYNHVFPSCTISATIFGCRNGIFIGSSGQYAQIINCIISNCGTGIYCTGPNIHISSCEINSNVVGITIQGDAAAGGNTDHCGIVACSLNHNQACGVFVKNLTFSLNITGCNIWASIGPTTMTFAAASNAQQGCFGVYIENSPNVNITGNLIARCNQLVGCDGWNNCIINSNHLLSDEGRTGVFIGEFGNTNSRVGNVNFNNIITNNIFDRALTSNFNRIFFHDNTTSYGYVMKNNRGTVNATLFNNLVINSVKTFEIGQEDCICIDANAIGLSTMPSNDPAGIALQATNIIILPHLRGERFEIQFYNTNQTKYWVWLKFKTSDTTTPLYVIGNGIMQHIPSNKAICINSRICNRIIFTPYGGGANQWMVCGANAV